MARSHSLFGCSFWTIVVLTLISLLNWVLFSSFKIGPYYALIPLLFALQLFFNSLVEHTLLTGTGNTRWFTLLVSPGTILHELSHAVAAVVSGCKVTSLSLFNFNKNTGVLGSVTYIPGRDRFSFLRDVLITFSPFFGCSLAVILISKYVFQQTLSPVFFEVTFTGFMQQILYSLEMLAGQYSQIISASPLIMLVLYLQLCFAFGAAPSGFDFRGISHSARRNLLGVLVLVFLLLVSAFLVQYQLPLGNYGNLLPDFILTCLNWIVFLQSLSLTLLIFSLILLYSTSSWLKAGFYSKVASITVFALAYYLSLPHFQSNFNSIVLSWIAFITVVLLAKNSSLFIKKQPSR